MSDIHVNPEAIAEAEAAVTVVHEGLTSAWESAKAKVLDCGWTGAAADAFGERFAEFDAGVPTMVEQIDSIRLMLEGGRDGLVSVDEQIASGMSG